MVKRIITALAIIAFVLPPLLLGGIFNYLLVALIFVMGGLELCALIPGYKKLNRLFFILPLLFGYLMLFLSPSMSIVLLALLFLVLLAMPVFNEKYSSTDAFLTSAVVLFLYVVGSAYVSIYNYNSLYIWFIIIATFATDIGAYFTGYFFGKRKLCERISPKKTIEGSIGGVIFSMVLSFLFVLFLFKDANVLLVVLGGLIMPFTSQIGDLSFSALKREHGIKDFSNVFPGHGGFIDRLDSLLFDLVVFMALMVVIL